MFLCVYYVTIFGNPEQRETERLPDTDAPSRVVKTPPKGDLLWARQPVTIGRGSDIWETPPMGQVYYVITDNLRYPKGVVIVTVSPRSLHNDFTK